MPEPVDSLYVKINGVYRLIAGEQGVQGESWTETFVTVSKNLKTYPTTYNRDGGGKLANIVYDLGGGLSITKTLNRDGGGKLASVVLSGDLPVGLADTTMTLNRNGSGVLTSITYS